MADDRDRAGGPPLPPGLKVCSVCREVRGLTADGRVSACPCSGLVCNRCGGRARRPVTDYYDPSDGQWWHVPYFVLMGHRCQPGSEAAAGRTGWTALPPAPEVVAYQEVMTSLSLALIGPDTELDLIEDDQPFGRLRLGRPS